MRHLQYAASPISTGVQRRVLGWLPECEVVQFYGMTEAAAALTTCQAGGSPRRPRRLRSVGAASPGRDGRGASASRRGRRAVGARAEQHARLLGRRRRPRPSWWTAGTAPATSRPHRRRLLYMVGRAMLIITRWREHLPESSRGPCCPSHPAVDEVAVFGIPDERWGEAVHAVVVRRGDVTVEELISHCRASLAGFKVPRDIELRDQPLPKSGAGKLLKNRLRDPYWAGRARRVG